MVRSWLDGEWDGNTKHGMSSSIRKYLLDECNWTCQGDGCGWNTPHPTLGYPQLEINHIDGKYRNNQKDNLEVLCLRCHGMTPNYKGLNKEGRSWRADYDQFNKVSKEELDNKLPKSRICPDCGKEKSSGSIRCIECHFSNPKEKINWPTDTDLQNMVLSDSMSGVAKVLGVSDNAVRKRCRRRGLKLDKTMI